MSPLLPSRSSRPLRLTRLLRVGLLALGILGASSCDQWLTRPLRYGSITVATKRRDGSPLAGTEVLLYTGQRRMWIEVSDAQGIAHFENVPYGAYGLLVNRPPSGMFVRPGRGFEYIDGIGVDATPLAPMTLTLYKAGPGQITLITRDQSGTPIPYVTVRGFDLFGSTRVALTDSTGQATFSVDQGYWVVSAEDPGSFLGTGLPATITPPAIFVDDASRDTVRFALTKCVGSHRFRVQTADGKGVANFPVIFYSAAGILGTQKTGADGTTTFSNLHCGIYAVQLGQLTGYYVEPGPGTSYVNGTNITPSSSIPEVVFTVLKL